MFKGLAIVLCRALGLLCSLLLALAGGCLQVAWCCRQVLRIKQIAVPPCSMSPGPEACYMAYVVLHCQDLSLHQLQALLHAAHASRHNQTDVEEKQLVAASHGCTSPGGPLGTKVVTRKNAAQATLCTHNRVIQCTQWRTFCRSLRARAREMA
jgi:hypothetical protein